MKNISLHIKLQEGRRKVAGYMLTKGDLEKNYDR